jgi:SAM-dependent methyltransferase
VTLWEAWEERAGAWIAWARAPDHDGFWESTWPELSAVLPSTPGRVVDIGCGEGRAGRELLRLGHEVIGVERSPSLGRAARGHTMPLSVVLADAARLPMREGCVDLAVSCMSFQDIDDFAGAAKEAARVLRPGGHFCAALIHPFGSAQDRATMHTDTALLTAPYLRERRYVDDVERDGLTMTFVSMHRPLSAYLSACFDAGLAMDAFRELGTRVIPWLLVMRFRKPA